MADSDTGVPLPTIVIILFKSEDVIISSADKGEIVMLIKASYEARTLPGPFVVDSPVS